MLRDTTSRGLWGLVCPSRTGSSRLEIEPKIPGWLVQDQITSPSRTTLAGLGPGTLSQGAPVFPGSSRSGIKPKESSLSLSSKEDTVLPLMLYCHYNCAPA